MRRLFGGEIDRPLVPILVVTLTGAVAGGMVWTFIGVWAVRRLGASDVQLAFAFLGAAVAAAVGGFLGGHLSDRLGRRPLILTGWAIAPLMPLGALAAGTHLWSGLGAIILLGLVGNIGQAANQALVPDLLPRERHEAGYATVRAVQNLGVVLRGAYIGAFGSTFAIGFALTPFVGLQVRGASGDAAMWVMFTCLAVAGAIVGFVACTRAFGLTGAAEGELEEMAVAAG